MNERRSSQGRTPISISENSESNQIDKLKKKIIAMGINIKGQKHKECERNKGK